jgi:hypothetical protein
MKYEEADQIWNSLWDVIEHVRPAVGTHTDPVRAKVRKILQNAADEIARIRETETT